MTPIRDAAFHNDTDAKIHLVSRDGEELEVVPNGRIRVEAMAHTIFGIGTRVVTHIFKAGVTAKASELRRFGGTRGAKNVIVQGNGAALSRQRGYVNEERVRTRLVNTSQYALEFASPGANGWVKMVGNASFDVPPGRYQIRLHNRPSPTVHTLSIDKGQTIDLGETLRIDGKSLKEAQLWKTHPVEVPRTFESSPEESPVVLKKALHQAHAEVASLRAQLNECGQESAVAKAKPYHPRDNIQIYCEGDYID